jgi:hypothetical protein
MIKKILMVLGVIFVALIGLSVVLLIWAHRAGAEAQEKFYADRVWRSGKGDGVARAE